MLKLLFGHILYTPVETGHKEEQHKVCCKEPILVLPNWEKGVEVYLKWNRVTEAEL